MQQHPIPQNITGFEFKLIGDMTIKQFAYLAGCSVLAYITYVLPLHPFVKLPLIIFLILLGIGLAFVPVEGRPLDRWILNFIRALFSPSQYIFHKKNAKPDFFTIKTSPQPRIDPKKPVAPKPPPANAKITNYINTNAALPTIDTNLHTRTQSIEDSFGTLSAPLAAKPVAPPPPPPPPAPPPPLPVAPITPPLAPKLSGFTVSPPLLSPNQEPNLQENNEELKEKTKEAKGLEKENENLRKEMEELKKKFDMLSSQVKTPEEEAANKAKQTQIMQEALGIENKLHDALTEQERLTTQVTQMKQKELTQTASNVSQPGMMQAALKQSETIKIIPTSMTKPTGLAGYSQYPNILAGIVKDAKGEVLPNIIVEVKDANANPVRAFKTNKLGQFSASTPLNNGTFTIELEDPKKTYSFEIVQITLSGTVLLPIEIMAKEKADTQRAQIYSSLFGQKPTPGTS